MKYLLILALLAPLAIAQPKRYIEVPYSSFLADSGNPVGPKSFSMRKAVLSWALNSHHWAAETTYTVYIKQSLYWKHLNLYNKEIYEYCISFDSVKGRGDKRKALIRMSQKVPEDSTYWWSYTYLDTAYYTISPDSTHWWSPLFIDSTRTYDSTLALSSWLAYSPKVMTPQGEAESGPLIGRHFNDNTLLEIRMTKILGDPTVNNGWTQRAMLRFKYRQDESRIMQLGLTLPDTLIF